MASYTVSRSAQVNATPERVHALVNDFRRWRAWSPWEEVDPELHRTYSGADSGVGARYAWDGNKKAGAGTMEITSSAPEQIRVALTFTRPFKSTSVTTFDIVPSGHGTATSWTMSGQQRGLMALIGRLFPMDKMIGKDFEKGLAQLKRAAESSE
ncbi:MAG: SRPBCC family protein [Nocardioides sp.]